MKKLILTLILAFLMVGNVYAATVSKSFTATGGGGVLSVKVGDSFTYSVSGTFVGTWVLQKSENGGNSWETVATGTGSGGATVLAESRGSNQLSYRMYCSAYTSGTIVTTMTDETGYSVPIDEFKNKNGKTVAHTTENGFVVDGSFTGGTEDGSVVFNVKNELYGAKGDGIQGIDGAISTGTDDFTSATAAFTPSDVGKVITIQNAGGTNIDLTTTISAYVSATAVTLAANASATVSNSYFTYGTDDTTAIRNAITAIGSSTNNGKSAILYFPAGTYIINGAFDQSGGSQIGFPANVFTSGVTAITMKGAVASAPNAQNNSGTILYGTRYGASGSDDIISVTDSSGGGTGNIARVYVQIDNIRFRTVQDPTHTAVNLIDVDQAQGTNVIFDTSATYNSPALPTHSDSYAIKMPGVLAGNISGGWRNLKIKSYYNGVMMGEHSFIFDTFIVGAVNGIHFFNCRYEAKIIKASIESVQNAVLVTSDSSTTSYFRIFDLALEHQTGTFANVTDLIDTSNLGVGDIRYSVFVVGGASANFIRTGGKFVSLHNLKTNQYEYRPVSGDSLRMINPNTDSSTTGGAIYLMQNDDSVTDNGSRLGFIAFGGLGATAGMGTYNYGVAIQALAAETFGASAGGSHLQIRTAPTGTTSPTERMRITSEGNVGIGTTTPTEILDIGTGTMRLGIGTTTAGTLVCVKSISGGRSSLGYCTGSLTNSICGTCN